MDNIPSTSIIMKTTDFINGRSNTLDIIQKFDARYNVNTLCSVCNEHTLFMIHTTTLNSSDIANLMFDLIDHSNVQIIPKYDDIVWQPLGYTKQSQGIDASQSETTLINASNDTLPIHALDTTSDVYKSINNFISNQMEQVVSSQHTENLTLALKDWITTNDNGIKQLSDEWFENRQHTVGGSSMATIMGLNHFSSIDKWISERSGVTKFQSDIKPQWGNLFEDVIARHTAYNFKCHIFGENMYIRNEEVSYSPDGLAVIDIHVMNTVTGSKYDTGVNSSDNVNFSTSGSLTSTQGSLTSTQGSLTSTQNAEIFLLEFKCPFTRIPNKDIPSYYVPQLLTGMEVIDIAKRSLFVQGLFKRCSWAQLGPSNEYNRELIPTAKPTPLRYTSAPMAYGFIGFYAQMMDLSCDLAEDFTTQYLSEYGICSNSINIIIQTHAVASNTNSHNTQPHDPSQQPHDPSQQPHDIGTFSIDLFTKLMNAYNNKIIHPWYGHENMLHSPGTAPVLPIGRGKSPPYCGGISQSTLQTDLTAFLDECKSMGALCIGVLPWKLFHVWYNTLDKQEGFLDQLRPSIQKAVSAVKIAIDTPIENRAKKIRELSNAFNYSGFDYSDDMPTPNEFTSQSSTSQSLNTQYSNASECMGFDYDDI